MPRKLNVYRTHIGFDDLIVAAPSKKAALEAWGASPHLFAQGFAAITDEAALVKAALARPGIVLRRQFGTTGEFKAEPSALRLPASPPKAPGPPRRPHPKPKSEQGAMPPREAKRTHDRAAEKREARERAAAARAEQREAAAEARAEARRREQETRDAAAAERRMLQGELEELTTGRWRRLSEIKQKEEALARERREIEQSFETRMAALRKRLRKI